MSGGLRQKIGLARTLSTNPKILTLYESTGALDVDSELGRNRILENLWDEITEIKIAHILETVETSDKITYNIKVQIKTSLTFSKSRKEKI